MELLIGVDPQGHLRISTRGSRKPTVALTFIAEGLALDAPACPRVVLPWDAYGTVGTILDGAPSSERWSIGPYTINRSGGAVGVAVRVGGAYERLTKPHQRATTTLWRLANAGMTNSSGGSLLVLRETAKTSLREFATLAALCLVLHQKPEPRPRLEELPRAQRLAIDLMTSRRTFGPLRTGIGRDSTDIHVAMQQAGFVHEYGRPLTTEGLPPLGDILREVVARLEANPYRKGREVDLSQVVKIVREDYLDVAPWPFAALVDD